MPAQGGGGAAHDCHNALKWGTSWLLEEPAATMSDFWVCIESLRNGFPLCGLRRGLLHVDCAWVGRRCGRKPC